MHDLTGNKLHSAIFTPMEVAQEMALHLLANYRPGQTILDPTCGSGNLLVACAEHLLAQGHTQADIAAVLYGCDIQAEYVQQCRSRLRALLGDHTCIDVNIGVFNFLEVPNG